MSEPIRLQRVLAEAGVASRRGAEVLIAAGRVLVDGQPAALGQRVDVESQRIEVDGHVVGRPQGHRYLLVSKPAGVTSTVSDRHAARTVLDLVPAGLRKDARLYPVGRLDRDSEGLILLTNDGALADRLLHPRYGVEREYAVGLAHPLAPTATEALRRGVELTDGPAALRSLRPAGPDDTARIARAIYPPPRAGLVWYLAVIAEGRKRQIRRMFGAVGAPVERLVRVRLGPLTLEGLAPGTVRALRAEEVALLSGGRAAAGSAREPVGEEVAPPPARAGPAPAPEDGVRSSGPAGADGAATRPRPEARPRPEGRRLVVALDGPGSSGKSTVGAAAAEYLGYRFCDTGMFYRAVTWLALERGVATDDAAALAALASEVELAAEAEGRLSRVLVGGRDVTDRVASPRVDRHVSDVSRQPEVRAALLPRQRELVEGGGIVMAGRDIGTVVLPDADLKLYLDASVEERARRRAEQRGLEPDSPAAERILAELRRRDGIDASRPVAPLRAAPDSVVIRTDGNSLGQTIDALVAAIRRRERQLARGR